MTAYFAYGSNMDPFQMMYRCRGARARGAARLADHRLGYTWDSAAWRGGVATILLSAGDEVWGVLWDIDARHERRLDRYEAVDAGVYRKASLTVEHDGVPVEALVYVATATEPKDPSKRYMRALVRGARAHALPPAYISRLEQGLDSAAR